MRIALAVLNIVPFSTGVSGPPTEKEATFEIHGAGPVYVVVDGYNGAAGSYTLEVVCTY